MEQNYIILIVKNNKVSTPYEKPMNAIQFNKSTNGVQRVIDKNKLFIDIDHTLYLMDKEEIIWKYIKHVDKSNNSWFRWSTYFKNEEINLDWVNTTKCK